MNQQNFIDYSPHLYDVARDIANAYRIEIRRCYAIAKKDLYMFKWDVEIGGSGFGVNFRVPAHWKWIERGRRPTVNGGNGAVYRAIREWIDVKGITPQQRRDRSGKIYVPSREGLAYLITRKIHQQGYVQRSPLRTALAGSRQKIDDFVATSAKILMSGVKTDIISVTEPLK